MTPTPADQTEISDTTSTTSDLAETTQVDNTETPEKRRQLSVSDLVATLQDISTMPGFNFVVNFDFCFVDVFWIDLFFWWVSLVPPRFC